MLSVRALVVALTYAITFNGIPFFIDNGVGVVMASPEPQVPGLGCGSLLFVGALCCAAVSTFKENVCPLASSIVATDADLPDLQTPVGIDCTSANPLTGCSASATPVCCATPISTATSIAGVLPNTVNAGVDCTPITSSL